MEAYEDEYFIPKDFGRRLSEKWTEENGERFHPALGVPLGLKDQRAVFVNRGSPRYVMSPNNGPTQSLELQYYFVAVFPSLIDHSSRYDVVQDHTDHFNTALEWYKSSPKQNRLRDLDLRNVHSWDDVTREFEQAQRKYAEKTKGWLGLPKKFGRVVGDRAESVYPFLAFIPDCSYTSPIKTALYLVFGV